MFSLVYVSVSFGLEGQIMDERSRLGPVGQCWVCDSNVPLLVGWKV